MQNNLVTDTLGAIHKEHVFFIGILIIKKCGHTLVWGPSLTFN